MLHGGLFQARLVLQLDFSKHALAAVLHQQTEEGERFIAARTKMLKLYKRRYYSTEGELLALVHGLDKFDRILACQKLTMVSDNLVVTNVTDTKLGTNAVLSRWLDCCQSLTLMSSTSQGRS